MEMDEAVGVGRVVGMAIGCSCLFGKKAHAVVEVVAPSGILFESSDKAPSTQLLSALVSSRHDEGLHDMIIVFL